MDFETAKKQGAKLIGNRFRYYFRGGTGGFNDDTILRAIYETALEVQHVSAEHPTYISLSNLEKIEAF